MFLREFIKYLKLYLFSFMVLLSGLTIFGKINKVSWSDWWELLPEIIWPFITDPLLIFLTSLPYLIYLIVRQFKRNHQVKGWKGSLHSCSLYLLLPGLILFSSFRFDDYYRHIEVFDYKWEHNLENTTGKILNRYAKDHKQRGVNYFARRVSDEDHLATLIKNNIEWVTIVPYGWQENYQAEQLRGFADGYGIWSRRDSSFINRIALFKQHGFRVMVKPHIWMRGTDEKWRSDIYPQGDAWLRWSKSYTHFILHYAELCQKMQADLFCIGTELRLVAKNYPDYWKGLIKQVREIYDGPITYAANWYEEVNEVSFWQDLDYIGIQAYYPLSKIENPSIQELVKGWNKHFKGIENLNRNTGKPILFTEIGYKSTSDATIEPWEWIRRNDNLTKPVSFETQANAYEAFFRVFWHKQWFHGVHFWQWHAGMSELSSRQEIDFTPQLKPAENVMAKWFGK